MAAMAAARVGVALLLVLAQRSQVHGAPFLSSARDGRASPESLASSVDQLAAVSRLLDVRRAVQSQLARHDAHISGGGKKSFSASDYAMFSQRYESVWAVRIHGDSVDYISKRTVSSWSGMKMKDAVRAAFYGQLHMFINLIRTTLRSHPEARPAQPIVILVNTHDKPVIYARAARLGPLPAPFESGAPQLDSASGLQLEHPAWMVSDSKLLLDLHSYIERGELDFAWVGSGRPPPVLSPSVVPRVHLDVLWPNRHKMICDENAFDPRLAAVRWEDKADVVSFKGFGDACPRDRPRNVRQRIMCHVGARAANMSRTLGVRFDLGGVREPPYKSALNKYLLLVDGVVGSFRSTWYLRTGSVILASGLFLDVRTQLLRPWVHYVPFDPMRPDGLERALGFLVRNPAYARWVGENARIAGDLLTGRDNGHTFDKAYAAELLRQYAQRYPLARSARDNLLDFTNSTRCDSFTAGWPAVNWMRIAGCLDARYACHGELLDSASLKDPVTVASGRLPL